MVPMPPQVSSLPAHVESQPTPADRAELTALKRRRNKAPALKQAMMQELLIGGTRLV
jgi:hypothetical protein